MGKLLRAAPEAAAPYDIVGPDDLQDRNGLGGSGTGYDLQSVVGLLLSKYGLGCI